MKFNEKYEILTPDGWSDFKGVIKKGTREIIRIVLSDGETAVVIKCTPDHKLVNDGIDVVASELKVGQTLVGIDGRQLTVVEILRDISTDVFDVVQVEKNNRFVIENTIISKNCDELAFVPNNIAEDFWTAMLPTLACVAGDTLVLSGDGFKRIEDYHIGRNIGDYFEIQHEHVFGKNGMEPLSHGYVSPESDTLILETQRGFVLEVTKNHPLYTFIDGKGKMLPSKDLKVGDLLRTQISMDVYGNDSSLYSTSVKTLSPKLAYLVGGWIAEGWISKRRLHVYISNTDDDFLEKYLNSDFVKPFKKIPSRKKQIYCCSKELVTLFTEIGIDPTWKCDTKRIPTKILTANKETQSAFLQGLFDGDGSVSIYNVNLSSTSRKLLNEVQLLLANMGIPSIVCQTLTAEQALSKGKNRLMPGRKPMKSARAAYELTISRANFKLFEDNVGFGIGRKSKKLRDFIGKYDQGNKTLAVPKTKEIIVEISNIVKCSGMSQQWYRDNGVRLDKVLSSTSNKGVITVEWFNKFKNLLNDNDLISEESNSVLDEFIGDFIWDRIISITPSKNKTYDFTVPGTHSFLQNGILGSNTGGACIITSTPKTDEDKFAEIYRSAMDNLDEHGNEHPQGIGKNGFFALTIPWNEHPDRDQAWAEEMRAQLGDQKFEQEMNCCPSDTNLKIQFGDEIYDQKIGDLYNTLKMVK